MPGMFWSIPKLMLIADSIAGELNGALKGGVSVRAASRMPTLLGLAIVRAKSLSEEPDDLAAAAVGLLREAAVVVDEMRNGPTATLLGLAEGTRGLNQTERRSDAAYRLDVNEDHFRKNLARDRIQELADELTAMDSTFQARLAHKLNRPTAIESRLEIDWLKRHEAYRRIWSPVFAMRADLLILLGYLHDDAPESDVADRLMNLLWRRAQSTRSLDLFVEEFGGLWLLSDPNKESQAAEAIYVINRLGPGGENDDSWLRLKLGEAIDGELDSFGDLVWQEEQGKQMVGLWLAWAKSCECALDGEKPSSDCRVHRWFEACQEFEALIDEDWDQVADWYRQERSTPAG